MLVKNFSTCLTSVEYPKEKTSWNIAGIIKGQNAFYRFDIREMIKLSDGTPAQKFKTNIKADKMVLEIGNKWIILDLEELHNYLKKNRLKKVYVNDLIPKLEWTIFLPKN